MKFNRLLSLIAILLSSSFVSNSYAHHSFAMFDKTQELFMSGTVTRWGFNAPHVFLFLETEDGTVWTFEGRAPQSLLMSQENPMTGYTLEPGQSVEVVICPLADGRPGGALGYIHAKDTWYRPGHGGCPADSRWEDEWSAAGYASRAEAEAAM
jgi:hypothetical protein